jgi:hypothetical protein
MGSKAFSLSILWPSAEGFHCLFEQPACCALSLSLCRVLFNSAKDVGLYACLWLDYSVILMGLIVYANDLRSCLIQEFLSLLKNCKPKRKNSLDLCACVCLNWYFPLRTYTHKLCNLELPTVCPFALSVNEFWDIYCPVCRFDGDGYDAFDLFHSMSTHLQAHLNFVKPSFWTTLSNCHKQLIETCNSRIVVCCFKF